MKKHQYVFIMLAVYLCIPSVPLSAWHGNGWNTGATFLNSADALFFYDNDNDAWIATKPIMYQGNTVTILRTVILSIGSPDDTLSTGDAQASFAVPAELDGMSLVSVGAHVYTASSGGTISFQIRKKKISDDTTGDMLSTPVTIDAAERDSSTAATAAVINANHDSIATGDEIYVDVDAAGTGAKGAEIRLGFRL